MHINVYISIFVFVFVFHPLAAVSCVVCDRGRVGRFYRPPAGAGHHIGPLQAGPRCGAWQGISYAALCPPYMASHGICTLGTFEPCSAITSKGFSVVEMCPRREGWFTAVTSASAAQRWIVGPWGEGWVAKESQLAQTFKTHQSLKYMREIWDICVMHL